MPPVAEQPGLERVDFSQIVGIANKTGKKLLKAVNLFDVYVNPEKMGPDKKSYAVSFQFENPEKTLRDKEVDKIMQQLIQAYQGIGAKIR